MCSIKNSGSVAAIFMSCNLGILQYFTIFYIKNYFMSFLLRIIIIIYFVQDGHLITGNGYFIWPVIIGFGCVCFPENPSFCGYFLNIVIVVSGYI